LVRVESYAPLIVEVGVSLITNIFLRFSNEKLKSRKYCCPRVKIIKVPNYDVHLISTSPQGFLGYQKKKFQILIACSGNKSYTSIIKEFLKRASMPLSLH